MTDQPKRRAPGAGRPRKVGYERHTVSAPAALWRELEANGSWSDGLVAMWNELRLLRRALDQLAAAPPDGIAVLMDLKQEATSTLDYFDRRTEQLMDILRTIRKNPDEYDPERPNGKEDRRRH